MNWLFQLNAANPVAHAIPLTMPLRILSAQGLALTLIQ